MGEKKGILYPDGERVQYEYDKALRLRALHLTKGEKEAEQVIRYTYDAYGHMEEKQLPGESLSRYAYDSMGRVTGIFHRSKTLQESMSYVYDAAGNKIEEKKERKGEDTKAQRERFTYCYDGLDRLVEVTKEEDLVARYTYDAFGNRTQMTVHDLGQIQQTDYTYNKKDQLIQTSMGEQQEKYWYDRRGNLCRIEQEAGAVWDFCYSAANQLERRAHRKEGMEEQRTYIYNGLGQRIGEEQRTHRKGAGAAERVITYMVDPTRSYHDLLQKKSGEEEIETFYWEDGGAVSMEKNGTWSYYMQDDLGSPLHLLNEHGESMEEYHYDVFGMQTIKRGENVLDSKEESLQPFGFGGYQMEGGDGIYFAQARRYDARNGRFMSEDPMKGSLSAPATQNPYVYCLDSPLTLVDRDGMCPNTKEKKEGRMERIKEILSMIEQGKADEDLLEKHHMTEAQKKEFRELIEVLSSQVPKSPQEAGMKLLMLSQPHGMWLQAGSLLKEGYGIKKDDLDQAIHPMKEKMNAALKTARKINPAFVGYQVGGAKAWWSIVSEGLEMVNQEVEFYEDPMKGMEADYQQLQAIKDIFAKGQEGKVLAEIGKGFVAQIKDSFEKDVIHGNTYTRSEYAGEVAVEIGSLFMGAGEAKKGMEAFKVAKEANAAIKAAEAAEEAAKTGENLEKISKVLPKVETAAKDEEKILKKTGDAGKGIEGGSSSKIGYEYLDEQLGGLKNKVTINKYQSAENINDWWEARGYNAPYKEKTVVQNITLTENTKFVRVYDGVNSKLEGGWVMRPEDIQGLTPKDIQAKFALEYEPKYIGEVELKAGDTIRLGEVGPNFGFDGGGIQIDLQQQWIGDFTEIGEIKTWMK